MEISAKIYVDDDDLLSFYNDPDYDDTPVEEVEEYVGSKRPFKTRDIPLLAEYHLLGEREFVQVEIQK